MEYCLLDPKGFAWPDHTFSTYARKKTDASQRIKLLKNITGDDQKNQRSPFFYGFYTFQEDALR